MSGRVIRAIVLKDLRQLSRSRLTVGLLAVALAIFAVLFWTTPDIPLGGRIQVGVCPASVANAVNATLAAAKLGRRGTPEAALSTGIEIVPVADETRLRAAVSGGSKDRSALHLPAAIALPDDFIEAILAGRTTSASVYVDAHLPEELRTLIVGIVHEAAHALRAAAAGTNPLEALPVVLPELKTITLGEERGGVRHSINRAKFRPWIAMLFLVLAAMWVSGLIASEIERRTITAILITPATPGDILVAKGLVGVLVCAGLSMVFTLATSHLHEAMSCVTALVFLCAVHVTALAMIAGSAGRGIASTYVITLLLTFPYALPFVEFRQHDPSPIVKGYPSYGITRALFAAIGPGHGWSHVAPHASSAAAWGVVLLCVGCVVLKRRVRRL